MRKINREGQVFGLLTVVNEIPERKNGQVVWNCLCECGNYSAVVNGNLQSGTTTSCGCIQKHRLVENRTKHGMVNTREYAIWKGMRSRCNNPNRAKFADYGARGINICAQWGDFAVFFKDMGPCPPGFSIERIDNDKGYEPANCVWASSYTQAWNTRKRNHETGVRGVRLTTSGRYWARICFNNEDIYLGSYDTLKEAIAARKQAESFYQLRSLSDTSNEAKPSAC